MINTKQINERRFRNIIFGDFLKYDNSRNMNQNFSASPVDFVYVAPKRTELKTVLLYIESTQQIHFEYFGSLTALTNGLRVWYKQKSTDAKIYLDAGFPIKTNGDFARLSLNIEVKPKSAGNEVFAGQWQFDRDFGSTLLIEKGGSFGITINDNLSGLTQMSIFAKGLFIYD